MDPKPAPSSPHPARPRVVVSGVNRRDILIGTLLALFLTGIIVAAIFQTQQQPYNMLTGEIRVKNAPGPREMLMTVTRKGVTEKTADSGYSLKVWVESEKHEYEVMLSQEDWEKKKIGDKLTFKRPPSEER